MTGPVYMENLLLSFQGKFENFYFAGFDNIKPLTLVPFLEDEVPPGNFEFQCNGLYFFQLGP